MAESTNIDLAPVVVHIFEGVVLAAIGMGVWLLQRLIKGFDVRVGQVADAEARHHEAQSSAIRDVTAQVAQLAIHVAALQAVCPKVDAKGVPHADEAVQHRPHC